MNKTLKQLHEEIKSGSLTIEALVESCRKTINEKDGDIHALLGIYSDELINAEISHAKEMFAKGTANSSYKHKSRCKCYSANNAAWHYESW